MSPDPPAGNPTSQLSARGRADWPGWAAAVLLAAGTVAIYARTFSVPLLFDDSSAILGNASIRRLWPLWPVLAPPGDTGAGGRPLLNLSYALNYAAGGAGVAGYHWVNLLVHVTAGWLVFALVRRTLRRPILAQRFGAASTVLAFAVAAIWAWHPVQTESVTYLSQRAESLMGLFYLLTIHCFVRGAETADQEKGTRRSWFALSVVACLAGVATKEVIVTAPFMAFLYDRTFISGSFSAAWRRHRSQYLALAATWLPLGFLMAGLNHRGAGFAQGISGWAYGLAECRVIVKYLGLVFWPSPLVFDYGRYAAVRLSEVWPYALALASLLAATVVALRRAPAAGFAACWFFVILAPTSSIVPVAGQAMGENRLYLPLAGVVAFVVLGAFAWAGRWSLPVIAAAAAGLAAASVHRNQVYSSAQALWSDTVAKNPANARAHNNLGTAWLNTPDRTKEAVAEYEEAVRLQPDYADAHYNLGTTWLKMPGHLNDAIAQFEEALRLQPDFAQAHDDLGNAWLKVPGRLKDAFAEYEKALRLQPDYAEAHNNLGNAWLKTPGRLKDALAEYEEALRLKPDYAEAHNNLGFALEDSAPGNSPDRLPEAIAQLEEALRLSPDFPEAHNNLGDAFAKMPGRLNDAIAQYEQAVRLRPDYVEAHYNLGNAWLKLPGRGADAAAQFEAVLRLKPDYAEAHNNLGDAWSNLPDRLKDAIAEYQAAVRLKPDYAEAHYNLGNAWFKTPGRLNDAAGEYGEAIRLRPDFADAHFNLAAALLKMHGSIPDAEAHLEAVVRLEPGNETALRILARLRAARP